MANKSKTGRGGQRDGVKERFWRSALKRQAKSGLSVRAFCRREKLSEPSFHAWRRTLHARDAEAKRPRLRLGPGGRPAFLPVVVADDRRGGIAIELAGGRVLRLSESMAAERLAELVAALEVADRPWRARATP
jgi:hypothetical protein